MFIVFIIVTGFSEIKPAMAKDIAIRWSKSVLILLSTILIVLGSVYIIGTAFAYNMEFFSYGLGFLFAGIAYPIIVYVGFVVLYFFNSLFLGILSLGRRKK